MAGIEQITKPKFRSFKAEFCTNFKKEEEIKKLKFCLCDHLKASIMFENHLPTALLNELEKPTVKSPNGDNVPVFSATRVNLLKEISDLVNIYQAKICVLNYVKENNLNVNNGASLKAFRKVLYEAMVASGPKEKGAIIAHYNTDKYESKWDVILYLENDEELKTRRDILELSRTLTGVGENIISVGVKKLVKQNEDGTLSVRRQKQGQIVSLSFVINDDDILKDLVEPKEGVAIRVCYQDCSFGYVELKKGVIVECEAPCAVKHKRKRKGETSGDKPECDQA